MKRERKVAFRAALEAGRIQREKLGLAHKVDYKSAFNLVTEVDRACEELIKSILEAEFEDDAILAEESGASRVKSYRRWLIDPLDGTTNFAHSYPFFCVSIGFEMNGEVVLGVVYNPVSDELFWAERGGGAFLNDDRLQVSGTKKIGESLLSTGFPPDTRNNHSDNMLEFKTLTGQSHGVRRDGSAALDLCFVAAGRTDGFWEAGLAPWDIAAGSLIVTEAGGKVSDLAGADLDLGRGDIIASNGHLHNQIKTALAEIQVKS
ncbi:MAG: inositol monophosphatase family protein [Candidatus Obscuribacterales bacterium]